MKKIGSIGLAVLSGALFTAGFSACDSVEQQAQSVGNDWVHASTPDPTPGQTPTPVPSPTPTTAAGDLYTGPAEVAQFVQKFVDDAQIQGRDVIPDMGNPKLEIRFASLAAYGSAVIGLCESGRNMRRVTFSPSFWSSVNDVQKELLAHHEFGHCVLYRAHRTDVLPAGFYASIMYPVIMSNAMYQNNYDYYQQELFSQAVLAPQAGSDPNQVTTYVCDLDEIGGGDESAGGVPIHIEN